MLSEQVTTMPSKPSLKVGPKGGSVPPSPKGYSVRKDQSDPNSVILQPQESELEEKLIGGQKELDINKNGKLDSKDFEMIRNQNDESYDIEEEDMTNDSPYKSTAKYQFPKDLQTDPDFIKFKENTIYDTGRGFESFGTPKPGSKDYYKNRDGNDEFIYDDDTLFESKKKPSAGLSKEKKSEVVKKAKAGKDVGKKGKTFKDIEAKAKASGAKEPKAVAAAAMWKNIKRESKNENTEVS